MHVSIRPWTPEDVPAIVEALNDIGVTDNTASCRVLEKAGFKLEGVLRQNAVKNGMARDMRLYSLVRGDMECMQS